MLPTDTQNVVYVGKKKVKRDTVAGTGLVWAGFGDAHRVPHSSAIRLFRHPDVWVSEKVFTEVYKQATEAEGEEEIPETLTLPQQIAPVAPAAGLSDVTASIVVPHQETAQEEEQEQNNSASDDGQDDEGGSDLSSVKAAILSLESGNEKHFSPKGKPLLDAVREAAGDASISVKDVNAAFAELNKAG